MGLKQLKPKQLESIEGFASDKDHFCCLTNWIWQVSYICDSTTFVQLRVQQIFHTAKYYNLLQVLWVVLQ